MYITISLQMYENTLDFEVDQRQKIKDFLDKVTPAHEDIFITDYVRSQNLKSTVSVNSTFLDNGIITGDLITII